MPIFKIDSIDTFHMVHLVEADTKEEALRAYLELDDTTQKYLGNQLIGDHEVTEAEALDFIAESCEHYATWTDDQKLKVLISRA